MLLSTICRHTISLDRFIAGPDDSARQRVTDLDFRVVQSSSAAAPA